MLLYRSQQVKTPCTDKCDASGTRKEQGELLHIVAKRAYDLGADLERCGGGYVFPDWLCQRQ